MFSVYDGIKCSPVKELKSLVKTVTVDRRQFTEEQYTEAKKKIAEYEAKLAAPREKVDQSDEEFAKPTTGDMLVMEMSYLYPAVELYENPILQEKLTMQTLKVGDIVFNSMPGEMFNELGLDLKARSKYDKNIIVELANGYYGYIATEKAFGEGGYEVSLDYFINLEERAGHKIVDTLLELQSEL